MGVGEWWRDVEEENIEQMLLTKPHHQSRVCFCMCVAYLTSQPLSGFLFQCFFSFFLLTVDMI